MLLAFADKQPGRASTLRVAVRHRGAFGGARAIGYLGGRLALAAAGRGAVIAWVAPRRPIAERRQFTG